MKTKVLFICTLFLTVCTIAAQEQKQATKKILMNTLWPLHGDYTYSYSMREDGTAFYNGPFTIVAQDNVSREATFFKPAANINGTYKLTGSHLNGNLHGTLNLNCKITVTETPGGTDVISYKLNGNFKDGLPHGAFNQAYTGQNECFVNVNYNNGRLVGSYSIKGITKDLPEEISGTLSSKGELTGRWKFGNRTNEYINSVLIKTFDGETAAGTPSLIVTKSTQFANGQISEKQLNAESIYVCTDSLDLGVKAWSLILRRDAINWDDFGVWKFGQSAYIKYKYLKQLLFFKDEHFGEILNDIGEAVATDTRGSFTYLTNNPLYSDIIDYDKTYNLYYVRVHRAAEKGLKYISYIKGPKNPSEVEFTVYLTDEQMAKINETALEQIHSKAMTIPDVLTKAFHVSSGDYIYKYLTSSDFTKNEIDVRKLGKDIDKYYDRIKTDITYSPDSTYCYFKYGGKLFCFTFESWSDLAVQSSKYEEFLQSVPAVFKDSVESKRADWNQKRHQLYVTEVKDLAHILYSYPSCILNDVSREDIEEVRYWILKWDEKPLTNDLKAKAQKVFEALYKRMIACEYDAQYLILTDNGNTVCYMKKSDIYELGIRCGQTDQLKESATESDMKILEVLEERKLKEVQQRVNEILKYISNKLSSDFTNISEVKKYFDFEGYENQNHSEVFTSHILEFTPISAYEIEKIYGENNEKIDCLLTVSGLFKKTNYRITLLYRDGKIVLSSLDKDNAQKLK